MAPAAKRRASRWADLPPELAEEILRRLPLDDYFPFGLACKSWWSAMIPVRSLYKPPPVLIMKPGEPSPEESDHRDRAIDAQVTRFYSIYGGGKDRDIPMMIPFENSHGVPATMQGRIRRCKGRVKTIAKAKPTAPAVRCRGSSMGWLFLVAVDDESSVHLLNPISAEKVALPALPPHFTLCVSGDILCSKPASDPDCIVAVKGYMADVTPSERPPFPYLLTCRPNDHEWAEIPCHPIITYSLFEARLYVISNEGLFIHNLDRCPTRFAAFRMPQAIVNTAVLAVMDGKLLCVCGAGPHHVLELVDHRCWAKIRSLGEWALLLNQFTSQAFSTKESPTLGFRANRIYRKSIDRFHVHSMGDDGSTSISPTPAGYPFQSCWFLPQTW